MPAWTTESRCKLLLAVIANNPQQTYHWEQIATTMGSDYNWNACRQQFHKMKKDFGPGGNPPSDNDAAVENGAKTSKPRASKKGEQNGKAAAEGNQKRKRKTKADNGANGQPAADENDDEGKDGALLKKIKTENEV